MKLLESIQHHPGSILTKWYWLMRECSRACACGDLAYAVDCWNAAENLR